MAVTRWWPYSCHCWGLTWLRLAMGSQLELARRNNALSRLVYRKLCDGPGNGVARMDWAVIVQWHMRRPVSCSTIGLSSSHHVGSWQQCEVRGPCVPEL